jgi:RNA-dependent RNA polymerase
LTDAHLEKAKELKLGYDQQIRRVMVQHSIKTEFEVWTAFVMEHNREQYWYSLAEDLGNLMSSIKTDFQTQVREYLGLTDSGYMVSEKTFDILAPFVAAMYTVTEQEVTQWKESKLVSIEGDTKNAPLITYPWLFSRELGKIATRQSGPSALRAAFTANGDVRRREPVKKSNYKAELHSIELEPVREWKPEHAVDDHVGKTAFHVAPLEEVEKKGLEVSGQDEEAVDEMTKETAKEIAEEDAVDGACKMEEADAEISTEKEELQEQKLEETTEEDSPEDQRPEEESSEEEISVEERTEEQHAEEERPEEEGAEEKFEEHGGEEEGAKEEVEEADSAYDRLMAMISL